MGHLDNHVQYIIDKEASELPLFIHFEHVQTNFVHVNLLVSTELVPLHLRPLLSIYMETFFALPMIRNGKRVEYEQVVMDLDRDAVNYGIDSGRELGSSEAIKLSLQVEIEEYHTAITWLKDLMFSSIFDIERIATTTQRLLAEIPGEKRSGSAMMQYVLFFTAFSYSTIQQDFTTSHVTLAPPCEPSGGTHILSIFFGFLFLVADQCLMYRAIDEILIATPASTTRARCTLVRALYLKHVKYQLRKDPNAIIAQLQEVKYALWQPSNFRVLVIADIEKLKNPVSAWSTLVSNLDNSKTLIPLETRLSRLSEIGKNPGNIAYIVPLPTIDSSFALASAKGPSSYDDPAIPALLVAAAYLNAVEGPFWTAVRGAGLAYGISLRQHRDAGQVSIDIYRSPDAYKAYIASKNVVEGLVTGITSINPLDLEGAISSIVLDFANGEATLASAAQVSFVRQVIRGQGKDYQKKMLEKARRVSVQEVKEAMKEIILPLFDPAKSILIVTCAPIMQEGLVKNFKELGLKPEVKFLADFQDDYGYKDYDAAEEGEYEDESEDEYNEDEDEDEDVEAAENNEVKHEDGVNMER